MAALMTRSRRCEACGAAHLKAILATGELKTLTNVYKASMVAMQAGADFIKTSTGTEGVNATLPVSLVMVRALRDYGELTGRPGRLQAGRRHQHLQGRARLADPDEGGAWRRLAAAGPVPPRRILPARRHRTAARTLSSPDATPRPRAIRWPEEAMPKVPTFCRPWITARRRGNTRSRWLEARKAFGHFIGGKFTEPGKSFEAPNPATGETLAEVARAGKADVEAAVAAAARRRPWSKLSGHERAKYLYAIARRIQKRDRFLAVLETMDNGKPIRETRDIDIPLVARHFYHHAGWAELRDSEFPGYRARWRVRPDHPVELPAADAGLEDRARAGGRLHRGAEAGRADAADRDRLRRDLPRGRPAGRRGQPRDRRR